MNELEELLKKLAEARKAMKALVAIEEPSEEQTAKLDNLNKEAVKLEAKITALRQLDEADKDEAARVEREKKQAVEEAVKAERAASRRLHEIPYQTQYADTNKYDDLNAAETALVIDTLKSRGIPVSGAAFKALSLKIGELKERENTDESRKFLNYVKNNFSAMTGIKADIQSIEAAVKAATDPMYTGGSGIGSDWVGTAYSSQLWESIRAANVIVSKIPSATIPDGYSSLYFPLESTDPTWYKVAEATASDSTLKVPAATVAASQHATANKQITVAKIGSRVLYTGELTEDSLISFAPNLRRQLEVSGNEILEHLAIDGDTETSANKNINDIAGTPGATDVFLSVDGFRKLALITNTANSRSASGTFVVSDFKDTLKLMGTAGLAGSDPNAVGFLVDYNVMWAALDLPEVKTRDLFSAATIENGMITRMYRVPVYNAFQMHRVSASTNARKVNTAGKVDQDTDGNNTTGAILAVRFDQWKQAFKRRMTLETTRIANADSWEIVALARWGMAYRDTEASAITYNVGV